ncbi:MAG: tRNA preQ1(34) S-adenosylmethionine ribosyltransferase-isomerase QueA, partial [Acidobacteria bacterium]
ASSRLLHVAGDTLTDLQFRDLPELISPNDLVVLNDTRVIRARLIGRKASGGRVEGLVERIDGRDTAWLQIRASHLPKIGSSIEFAAHTAATVIARDGRLFHLRFGIDESLLEWLERHGEVPLPPYIARRAEADDALRYQTVYARHAGAVAAPTAGLHFDQALLDALALRGIKTAFVTLHVGAGTFAPVDSDDIAQHRMHSERFDVPAATAEAIAAAHARGGQILAVGTTTLRALESSVDDRGDVRANAGDTRLFVTPGFRFRAVDRLLTNFHLPKSTLLMLVSAFAGLHTIRRAYAHAIASRYRFFSYGDAMLLEKSLRDR